MIGWGATLSCRRISAYERVEQVVAAQVPDEYPHRRDPERERESLFMTTLIGLDGAREV